MGINENIILSGQQPPSLLQTAGNGLQFGQGLKNLLVGKQLKDIVATSDDPKQQAELAKNSMFSSDLVSALKINQQKQIAQTLANQKTQSEITKNQGDAYAQAQKGQGQSLDNASKIQSALQTAIGYGAQTGDKNAIMHGLDIAKSSGLLSADQYQAELQHVNSMSSIDELKQYGQNALIANSKDPAQYTLQTANNAANNATSIANNTANNVQSDLNNQRTTNATLSGQENQKNIATMDNNHKDNRIIKTETAPDGTVYGVFANGGAKILQTPNGQTIKASSKDTKLSDGSLKMVSEANTQLQQATQNQNKVDALIHALQSGNLNVGLTSRTGAGIRNLIGKTNENDRQLGTFETALNQAANDVLMAAKGTQTEGDAKRAVETLMASTPRDKESALQVLLNLKHIQDTTINSLNSNIDNVYNNSHLSRPSNTNPKEMNHPSTPSFSRSAVSQIAKQRGISEAEVVNMITSKGGKVF